MKRIITLQTVRNFRQWLTDAEKSENTVAKYLRDVRTFTEYLGGKEVTKENAIEFKQHLTDCGYAVRSINSMIAAVNCLFTFLGWNDFRLKTEKVQKLIFLPEDKVLSEEDYRLLCRTAEGRGDRQLSLMIQTICATGIRVSELQFITVDAVKNGGVEVKCKGKRRPIILVKKLRHKLLAYIRENHIREGAIFLDTKHQPISRTNVWRKMKSLCQAAHIDPKKVYPHNLRHLFARVFYRTEKDIAKLADVLGHSSIETTRLYLIGTGREHRACMELMHLTI